MRSLESALGGLRHIYHESLPVGGEEGLEHLEKVDQRSHQFVKDYCQAGAVLEATEDAETFAETLDLQRCLMLPYASQNVARKIQEWYSESNRRRYEHISKQIDATLADNEVGLLLVSERHQIQFPPEIEVFYVSPPALDEFRRWMQDWVTAQQKLTESPEADAPES